MVNNKNITRGRNTQTNDKNIIEHDERMVPEVHKGYEIYGEHIARYEAVLCFIKGKLVLDIASGSGYGTQIMSKHAKNIYGVDISKEALQYSKKYFSGTNIEYLLGNGEEIPLKENSVEVVTSFETIEHIKDYRQFLSEVKRVLTEDGILIISTPNDLEFTEGNHFHLHQFEEQELLKLMKQDYKYIERFYQTTWILNTIGDNRLHLENWRKEIDAIQTTKIPNNKVLYFYFVCSNRPIIEIENFKPLGVIGEHWSEKDIRTKINLTDRHIRNLEGIAVDRLKYIHKLEKDINKLNKEIKMLNNSSPNT